MSRRITLVRDGTRLALADLGGDGRPILFLHGLAGHAEEWVDTASWLSSSHQVFALDLRGHGHSERTPAEVGPDALVRDVLHVLKHIGGRVILAGQSLGGAIGLRVAASRPDLVHALVVIEASPDRLEEEEASALIADVGEKLGAWPVPFASEAQARAFFAGPSLVTSAWVGGLEQREDGLWPRFEVEVLLEMARAIVTEAAWDAWEKITCPVLIVRGQKGSLSETVATKMANSHQAARVETIEAGHDVHLDDPAAWREVLSAFLSEVGPSSPSTAGR